MRCYVDGCTRETVPGFGVCLAHITDEKIRESVDKQIERGDVANAILVRVMMGAIIDDSELLCFARDYLEDCGYWEDGGWTKQAHAAIKHWTGREWKWWATREAGG